MIHKIEFGNTNKTNIRPKMKAGPATGASSWLLWILILGATEMAFYIILMLDLVQMTQLEIWVYGASLGVVASALYYILTRSVYKQGQKSMQGRW